MNTGLLLVIAGGIILTFGDIIMKRWIGNNNRYLFALGIIVYLCGTIFLAFSFKYKNIAVASMMMIIFNILLLTVLTYLYFKEPLNLKQMIGIAVGILSVIILEW